MAAEGSPQRPAVWVGGRTITYRQCYDSVQRSAHMLASLGLERGMTLATVLPNGAEAVIYGLAAHACDAAIAPFDPTTNAEALGQRIKMSGARLAVMLDEPAQLTLAQALLGAQAVDRVLVVETSARWMFGRRLIRAMTGAAHRSGSISGVIQEREALRAARLQPARALNAHQPIAAFRPAAAGDIAIRLVTPRADGHQIASLSHAITAAGVDQLLEALPPLTHGEERILVLAPLSSQVAMTATLNLAVAKAGQLICLSDANPNTLFKALKRTRPTMIVGTTAQLSGMVANPALAPAHFGDLKLVINLDWDKPQRLRDSLAQLTGSLVLSCYAVESIGALISIGSRVQPRAPQTVGHVLPGTKLVVRDLGDLTRIVGQGERGELCVGGPQVVAHDAPSLVRWTAGHTHPGTTGANAFVEGLLRTGDLGAVDHQGQVFVVDRIDDMIVAAGYLIYPRRIEAALEDHPGISEVCVIGVGDKRRGQAPKAFVVLKRGIAVTERDLRLHLASRVSKIEMPSDIDFCTTLPRTPSGAVCRATLRAQDSAADHAR
jgi:long-chain acyl-CoA synthetase